MLDAEFDCSFMDVKEVSLDAEFDSVSNITNQTNSTSHEANRVPNFLDMIFIFLDSVKDCNSLLKLIVLFQYSFVLESYTGALFFNPDLNRTRKICLKIG